MSFHDHVRRLYSMVRRMRVGEKIHYTEVAFFLKVSPTYARNIMRAIASADATFRYDRGWLVKVGRRGAR